ncbi:MAG: hypothetical protein NWF06_10965 [Candidatus Bathyarchaeota archaeon]|nr:hypothetical protein [Candidatus Bathyarchaeum sp.]
MNVKDLLRSNNKDLFYIMHLSYEGCEQERFWNYAREKSIIGISHPFITEDWNSNRDFNKKALTSTWVKQFDMFCNEMTTGDVVLVLSGCASLLGVAEVIEPDYMFDGALSGDACEPFFEHIRKVKWHKTYTYAGRLLLPQPVEGFVNVLSKVEPMTERWQVLENVDV